jgi:hypothetical protein
MERIDDRADGRRLPLAVLALLGALVILGVAWVWPG